MDDLCRNCGDSGGFGRPEQLLRDIASTNRDKPQARKTLQVSENPINHLCIGVSRDKTPILTNIPNLTDD